MGTSTIVYTSLVNTINPATTTCAGMGLPALPTGWIYNCPTSTQSLRNTDGTGWIPVNFQRISSNSPISQLPVDPQNTTSTKYYTYVTGGSWKVIATPESVKYMTTAGADGGSNIGQFEVGNNMSLAPFTDGLVGWWKFEGDVMDSSGFGNNGTWNGTSTSRYSAGRVGQFSGNFNGSSDYVDTNTSSSFSFVQNTLKFTIAAWVKMGNINSRNTIIGNNNAGARGFTFMWETYGGGYGDKALRLSVGKGSGSAVIGAHSNDNLPVGNNEWHHVAVSSVNPGNNLRFYLDGDLKNTYYQTEFSSLSSGFDQYRQTIGVINYSTPVLYFSNAIDDVRIYNRALSAAEISALYSATK